MMHAAPIVASCRKFDRYACTTADATESGPVPRLLVALTVHVYDLPAVSPVTVIGLALPDFDLVAPPFDDVHVTA